MTIFVKKVFDSCILFSKMVKIRKLNICKVLDAPHAHCTEFCPCTEKSSFKLQGQWSAFKAFNLLLIEQTQYNLNYMTQLMELCELGK